MKRTGYFTVLFMAALLLAGKRAVPVYSVYASELNEVSFISEETPDQEKDLLTEQDSVPTATDVTEEMCSADYWFYRNSGCKTGINRLLITKEEIQKLNEDILAVPEANMHDLVNMPSAYNADELRKRLVAATAEAPKEIVYVNTEEVKAADYYGKLAEIVDATGYTGGERQYEYCVAVKRTIISSIPGDAYIGYSASDTDDEKVLAALCVNEPFLAGQKARVEGKDYYWGYSDLVSGWVAAEDLAICTDKQEWLDAWKTEPGGDDFIVVTQNRIDLEPLPSIPELSGVKLTFATILKSVPEDKYPVSVGERGPWNNYVVYLPTRDENGRYVKRVALISQHNKVSTGYPDMTQAELLRVAFNNLGDRYGWGGMLDSMDCSLFSRNVYRCFGLNIPRNTNWQQKIPGRRIELAGLTDEEKLDIIKKLPAGTILFFPGHIMLYTGCDRAAGEDMAFVISDSGSLSDSTGELDVRSMYSIILNPLTVRRRAGTTWLENITAAVLPISGLNFDFVEKNLQGKITLPDPRYGKVPAAEGQTYASSRDTLPLETFLNSTQDLYISFSEADDFIGETLFVTAVKGSRITTRSTVESVVCDKSVASKKIDKTNGLATITLKKSGQVTYKMSDGKTFNVYFTVEKPRPAQSSVKEAFNAAKDDPSDTIALGIGELFGTQLDGGTLSIVSQKNGNAGLVDNVLIMNRKIPGSVKLKYTYLDKTWTIKIESGR